MQPAQWRQSYSHRMRSAICRAREIVGLQAGKFFNQAFRHRRERLHQHDACDPSAAWHAALSGGCIEKQVGLHRGSATSQRHHGRRRRRQTMPLIRTKEPADCQSCSSSSSAKCRRNHVRDSWCSKPSTLPSRLRSASDRPSRSDPLNRFRPKAPGHQLRP